MRSVWLLLDDRIGNVNQILGIGSLLKATVISKTIRYNGFIKLPNVILRNTLIGLSKESRKSLKPPFPDLVISAGRRSLSCALWIKKQSKGKTKIAHLMNPGSYGRDKIDLLILPQHDKPVSHTNLLRTIGTPNKISADFLKEQKEKWNPLFKAYPPIRLGLIVGGSTKDKVFTLKMAEELIEKVKKIPHKSVLITTSRRTPAEIVEKLKKAFTDSFFYQWGNGQENPYFGILSCSDLLVVTGDSISMCSECCACHKPVFIFANPQMVSAKHLAFHETLYQDGYAVPLGEKPPKEIKVLQETKKIIQAIEKLFTH